MTKKSFNERLKNGFKTAVVIFTAGLLFAGCNDNPAENNGKNPNGQGGKPPIEDVQTTIDGIIDDYISENNLAGAVQNAHEKCVEEVVCDAIDNVNKSSIKTTYKNGEAVVVYKFTNSNGQTQLGSIWFDVSGYVQQYLEEDLADLLLYELGEYGDTTVSESLKNTYYARLDDAMDEILSSIKPSQYTAEQTNKYAVDCGISSSLKTQVLNQLEKQNSNNKLLEPVAFGAPREDGSAIITGTDAQGNIKEFYFKLDDGKDMPASAFYQQISSGNWDEFTTRTISASRPYVEPSVEQEAPPPKEMVSVSDLYDQVFAGFEIVDLKELMDELANSNTDGYNLDTIFAEFDKAKTEVTIYAEDTDKRGRTNLLKLTLNGAIIEELWNYQNFKDMTEAQIKQYFLEKAGINEDTELEKDSAEQMQVVKDLTAARQNFENTIETLRIGDSSKINVSNFEFVANGGGTVLNNINQYGEKLLEKEGNVEVLKTYLSDWKGRNFDSQNRFGTGYLEWADACIVYKQNGKIKIYQTDVAVPWYTDSTTLSKYQSILNNIYSLRNEQTTEIQDAILFEDSAKSASEEEYVIKLPVDLFYDDEVNRA